MVAVSLPAVTARQATLSRSVTTRTVPGSGLRQRWTASPQRSFRVHEIRENIISPTLDRVREATLLLLRIKFLLKLLFIIVPRISVCHHACCWLIRWVSPACAYALVDQLPQDSSPAPVSPVCHPACAAAPPDARQTLLEVRVRHSACEGAPALAYLAVPGCFPHCSCVVSVIDGELLPCIPAAVGGQSICSGTVPIQEQSEFLCPSNCRRLRSAATGSRARGQTATAR